MAKLRVVDHTVFVEGGLLNNVDVECTEFEFVRYNFEGKAEERTCLHISMKKIGSEDEPVSQYLSVGGSDDFVPSEDGMQLLAAGDRNNINVNSNYALFMASMEKEGLEKSNYAGSIGNLDGIKVHINRVPDPRDMQDRRTGSEVKDDKPERPREVLVVTNIISTPWDAKGGKSRKGAAKATGKTTAKPKAQKPQVQEDEGGDEESAESLATSIALKLLAKQDWDLADLAVQGFQAAMDVDKATRKEIMRLLGDEDFVSNIEGVEMDGEVVSIG